MFAPFCTLSRAKTFFDSPLSDIWQPVIHTERPRLPAQKDQLWSSGSILGQDDVAGQYMRNLEKVRRDPSSINIALVHDYLNQYGGAEQVLEAFHEIYPKAPVYTSIYAPGMMPSRFLSWRILPRSCVSCPTRRVAPTIHAALSYCLREVRSLQV